MILVCCLLYGVDRINILTDYAIVMTHQTKTVVDAAEKRGVRHIVNQGVFAAEDATDSRYCWFALVESYIEARGIAWTHLHPNVFLENILSVSQPIGGTFSTFWRENRVYYVALHDLAAVTAKVLFDGPERHGSKDYYLSAETMTGSELATVLSEVPDRSIRFVMLGPSELEERFKKSMVQVED